MAGTKRSKKPNTKVVPSLIVLIAAAISSVVSLQQGADLELFVMRLFAVVIIFLFLGTVAKMVLDNSFKTMDDPTLIEQLERDALEEAGTDGDDSTEESE